MFLHYFKKNEIKEKKVSEYLFHQIIENAKKISKKEFFMNNNDFDSTFEIVSLLIISLFYGSKNNNNEDKIINQELMNIFISDLDISLRLTGVGDMKIGKHVKYYVKKFYFRLPKLELVFDNQDYKKFKQYLLEFQFISMNDDNLKSKLLYKDLLILQKRCKNKHQIKSIFINLFN